MEEDTQTFRLAGNTTTKKIPCDHVNGISVIYWEDIEQGFPGVLHIMNGEVLVTLLRGSNGNRIVPFRIKHHPGVVLEVALSTMDENTFASLGRDRDDDIATTEKHVENSQVTQLPADTSNSDDGAFQPSRASSFPPKDTLSNIKRSRMSMSFSQIATLARKDPIQSKIEQ
ncbi:hypothetical protein BGX34_005636 [Mortierella sp. NVP85]|nr:hypothetical protein BGX34_005636 [Mortierella sp. NVP85]